MFTHTSRYYRVGNRRYVDDDGQEVLYKERRFLPRGAQMTTHSEVQVRPGERLDLIANRTLGDPLHFWHVCDANDAMDPFELVSTAGRKLRIPSPNQ